jgi:para-aminobenzoate synthetase/4-amino-4-deoxychorismate lyase
MRNHVVLHDAATRQWLHFSDPRHIVEAHRPEEVLPALRRIDALVQEQGLHAAGFISYEAAPAFDRALQVRAASDPFPLLWFGLFPEPEIIPPPRAAQPAPALHWTPTIGRAAYDEAIAHIKEHIARGDTYQVNYTFRLRAPFSGDPWPLFQTLAHVQQADYAAFVETERYAICSASPELFFRLDGSLLASRPMKGTAARGRWLAEDEAQAEWLHHSEKNRAENVMIVDMIRNDLGRVARTGTVNVPRLFAVEKYPTVWQMTSTVEAQTDASLPDIMAALFPCASITGAPKARTMQIISDLETTPRRLYTGTIGFIAPDRRAQFNVAIRTVLVDRQRAQAEYGVGGGIVWDSDSAEEYAECETKARVLTAQWPDFSLLETILWEPNDGYFLLPYHLRRLQDSARYFDFPADPAAIHAELTACAATLPHAPHRVRLLLARDGTPSVHATPLADDAPTRPVRLGLAPTPVNSASPFLYHKTTHRQLYEEALASRPDCDDVLLWNERGEITETAIANIVLRLDNQLVTPPLSSGLLPGTFRASLIDQGEVREQVITREMLHRAQHIYRVNSVRKWQQTTLLPPITEMLP